MNGGVSLRFGCCPRWRSQFDGWRIPDLCSRCLRRQSRESTSFTLARTDLCSVGAPMFALPTDGSDGLLDEWLNCEISVCYPPTSITLRDYPHLQDGRIVYTSRQVPVVPAGAFPLEFLPDGAIEARWPPKDRNYKTVSPDAESEEIRGPFDAATFEDLPVGISKKDGRRTLWFAAGWPERIQLLMAGGDGADVFLARQRMIDVAKRARNNLPEALIQATQEASAHVFDGHAPRGWSEFGPLYSESGDEALLFAAEDHDVAASSSNELWGNERFLKVVHDPVFVRRAWGVAGFFWALMLDRLKDGSGFNSCERCGRIIPGKNGKRLCGPEDNSQCLKKRRADDQRRSRRGRSRS